MSYNSLPSPKLISPILARRISMDNETAKKAAGELYMHNDVTIQWIYHNGHDDQVRTSAHNFK